MPLVEIGETLLEGLVLHKISDRPACQKRPRLFVHERFPLVSCCVDDRRREVVFEDDKTAVAELSG